MTLALRIQLQIGLLIALVIMAVTGISYRQTVDNARGEALDNLRVATQTRANLESTAFLEAQDNTAAMRDEYLRRLRALGNQDPLAEFNAWFVRYPDGLIRVRPERDDFKHLPSIYIRAKVPVTAELRRQVVAAFGLLREWGPPMTLRYYSAYIDLPGLSLIMYSPSVNWGKEADPTTNNFDYPPVQNSAPDKNPTRSPLWTEVYFDDKANIWMLSIITPMDQGRWIGTASQDIAVEDLIRRTTSDFAAGTYNLVIDSKGKLVAHPQMMEKIRSSAGNLDISTLGDPLLREVYEEAVKLKRPGSIVQTSAGDNYLGISRIQGPGWYFVTVYPAALVAQRGLVAARSILVGGAIGLVFELGLLAWIIRRQVADPLRALSDATKSIAQGDMRVDLRMVGKGELERLARNFLSMTEKLRQRDDALQARATELEHEVAQRKRADASLAVSETFKDTLLQTIPDVVFVKNREGAFIAANRAFESVYGKKLEAILGKTDFDFLPHDQARYFAECDREAFDAGVSTLSEAWQHNTANGKATLYETIKTPVIAADGTVIGLLGIGRDITDRKRTEQTLQELNQELEQRVLHRTQELEQSNAELTQTLEVLKRTQHELVQGEKQASLGRMVAGLAHELNTPIGNALTIGTTLGDHARSARAAMESGQLKKSTLSDFLRSTVDGTSVLERALRQASELIASFKQVSADQLSERRRVFDLAVAVEEILSTLRPGLRATPFRLESQVPGGIIMDSYPGVLAQVLSNLVNNASMHAFDGRDHGTVCVRAVDLGNEVEIHITDDGVGIPESIQDRIFDPFFTTRMGRGGTGLGLSIVHNAVTQGLLGAIRVEPGASGGTCFIIRLTKRDARPTAGAEPVLAS